MAYLPALALEVELPDGLPNINWFPAVVSPGEDGAIAFRAILYFPGATYRPPETMLRLVTPTEGVLHPLPPPGQ